MGVCLFWQPSAIFINSFIIICCLVHLENKLSLSLSLRTPYKHLLTDRHSAQLQLCPILTPRHLRRPNFCPFLLQKKSWQRTFHGAWASGLPPTDSSTSLLLRLQLREFRASIFTLLSCSRRFPRYSIFAPYKKFWRRAFQGAGAQSPTEAFYPSKKKMTFTAIKAQKIHANSFYLVKRS